MYPKPHRRIVDKSFYQKVRDRDGCCLWGLISQDGCEGKLEVHHVISRGRGGDDALDNGIVLCKKHHVQAHRHEISVEQLQETINAWG
jgi:5-methylcytosine-specific restriction endonuclease McrA